VSTFTEFRDYKWPAIMRTMRIQFVWAPDSGWVKLRPVYAGGAAADRGLRVRGSGVWAGHWPVLC